MTQVAEITVSISTRNRPDAVQRCLAALMTGETVPSEVVVVDQSDDDRTRSVVQETDVPALVRLRYLRDSRRGLAVAQNLSIVKSSFPVIAVTDDDCVPAQDWVRRIDETFRNESEIVCLTGRVLPLGPEQPGYF